MPPTFLPHFETGSLHAVAPKRFFVLVSVRSSEWLLQHFSFYDLIVTKARGKSGPLFHFDVHDDIRLVHDTRVEKDESHPGKVRGNIDLSDRETARGDEK